MPIQIQSNRIPDVDEAVWRRLIVIPFHSVWTDMTTPADDAAQANAARAAATPGG